MNFFAYLVVLLSFSQISVAAEKSVNRKIANGISCVEEKVVVGPGQTPKANDRKASSFVVTEYAALGVGPKETASCPLTLFGYYPERREFINVMNLNAVNTTDKNYPCIYGTIACSNP